MSLFNNSRYSIGARWIHTMTGPPLERHFINVVDHRIESFTPLPREHEAYDFEDACQILPGTVNMHAHLELSQLEKPLDSPVIDGRRPMADWVVELMKFRRGPEYDAQRGIWNAFLRRDVSSETVAVADIVPPDFDFDDMKIPKTPVWCRFVEVIDWHSKEPGMEAVLCRNPRTDVRGSLGLSPHAPHTVHGGVLETLVKRKVPLAMHLAETSEEIEFLRTGGGPLVELMRKADPDYDPLQVRLGKRPMDYLQLLSKAPQTFVIHGNYLDDEEIEFLAERRETMAVVYCPRSHDYFGHREKGGEYPLKKMLDRGVRVVLGTDSLASTPDLSILHEIRFAIDRHPNVSPETFYRMGTCLGAETLGLSDEFGFLRPGGPARFAFFPYRR